MLSLTTLKADIPTTDASFSIKVISTTCLTEVWITLSDCEETWALLSVALCFTTTSRKTILTVSATLAELLAEVLRGNADA